MDNRSSVVWKIHVMQMFVASTTNVANIATTHHRSSLNAQSARIPIIRQTDDIEWLRTSRSNMNFNYLVICLIVNDQANLNCSRRLLLSSEPVG